MIITIYLAAFVIMLASLAGVLFVWRQLGQWLERNLKYLVAFALGIFTVVVYSLSEEALHLGESKIELVFGLVGGIVLLALISQLIPDTHHHHSREECKHEHSQIDARRLLASDGIHNIADGLILVPAFIIDWHVGIVTTLAIFAHELVQEISEFFVLRQAGYSTHRALWLNFLVSATILIGVSLGLLIISVDRLVGPLIAAGAGAFLYVILRDLLPSTIRSIRQSGSIFKYGIAIALGVTIMIGVEMAIPHEHDDHDEVASAIETTLVLK